MVERPVQRQDIPQVINKRVKGKVLFEKYPPVISVPPTSFPSLEDVAAAIKKGEERLRKAAEVREINRHRSISQMNAERKKKGKPLIIG